MELLNKYKNFIFDLDGTLIDSMHVWSDVDERFLNERGIELTKEYTDKVKSCAMLEAANYTVTKYNLNETPEEVIKIWDDMVYEQYKSTIKLKDGVIDILKSLSSMKSKNPQIKLAVATALTFKNAEAALKSNRIKDYFDVILTLDDLEGNVDKTKPDIYIEALRRLGSEDISSTIIFEDVYAATVGAMKGGFDVCSVYDSVGSSSDWSLMEKSTKYAIKNWHEISV